MNALSLETPYYVKRTFDLELGYIVIIKMGCAYEEIKNKRIQFLAACNPINF